MSGLQVDWNGDIYGDWTLDSLTTDTGVALHGHVTTATLTAGNAGVVAVTGGSLTITGDASVAQSANGVGGIVVNAATFTELGTLTLGLGDGVAAANASKIVIGTLVSNANEVGGLSVDSTSSLEIGAAGTATAGQIVIDAGQMVSDDGGHAIQAVTVINNGLIDSGYFVAQNFINNGTLNDTHGVHFAQSASIVNNGVINAAGNDRLVAITISNNNVINDAGILDLVGAVSGTGQINVGANASLFVEGDIGASQSVAFTGEVATLELGQQPLSSNQAATIEAAVTGFDGSDIIYLDNVAATSTTWSGGVLTVLNGTDVVTTLNIQGNFASSDFALTSRSYNGHSQAMITLVHNPADTVTAPAGTASGDTFMYQGLPNGSWDVASNWGVSGLLNTFAPGAMDNVRFMSSAGALRITGTGNAANVSIENVDVTFSGQFAFASLTNSGSFTVASGTVTTGAIGGDFISAIKVASGAKFVDTGDLAGGINASAGAFVVGGTLNFVQFFQSANVSNGGSLQVGGVVTGAAFNSINVDSTSTMEVGAGGHVVAGELLVDAGALITNTGVTFVGVGLLENDGVITSQMAMPVNSDTAIINKGTISGAVTLTAQTVVTNSGHLDLTYNAGIVAPSILNTGLISDSGDVSLTGTVTGAGEIDVDSSVSGGATLSLSTADIAAGQTIKMIGAASGLLLDATSTVEATITGFGVGDTIQVSTGFTSATYTGTRLSLFNGSTLVETLTIGAGYGAAHFTVAFDGNTSTITTDSNAVVAVGKTYTLTKKADAFAGGAGNDTFVAAAGALSAKDVIDGGAGSNTLSLVGGGKFDLTAPQTLAHIQTLSAVEGAGDAMQTITLRGGLNLTVNVGAALAVKKSAGDHLTRAHEMEGECDGAGGDDNDGKGRVGIRLIGGADSSVFNLGAGVDVVTLGSATETVNGGTGDALIHATAATAGALITGGAGSTTLDVTGGGAVTMNAGDSAIDLVSLDKSNSAYSFTANAQAGLVIEDNSNGLDTIRAGGAGQTLTGGAAGKLTMIGSAAGGDTFRNTAQLFNGDTVGGFTAPGDVLDITDLRSSKISKATFVENSAGTAGTLTLVSGSMSVKVALLGQFMAAGFSGTAAQAGFAIGSDGGNGTNVTYHPVLAPGH